MALVPAKCTQCGGNIEVDDTHEAGICQHCGTPFITEKAIYNYTTNVTNNINANVVNIYGSNTNDFQIRAGVLEKYNGASTEVVVPNNVTSIGEKAFMDCKGLISVTLPNGITSIGESAFENCENLRKINIPEKVTIIENYTFLACTRLESIDLPRNITKIGWGAFSDCTSLKNIDIPHTVTDLGMSAFSRCTNLNSINLPNSLKSIDIETFNECVNLKHVDLPSNITDIRKSAFYNCKSLTEVNIPNSVEIIGDLAFASCTGMLRLTLPSSTKINGWAFAGCSSLQYVVASDGGKIDINPFKSTPFYPKKSTGCYIATCVYGSYDCPQVWTLRRYRDYTLDETWYGRLFIKCYYAVSPKLVKWLGNYSWFRKPWKKFLDGMVERLNSEGIADTKYSDKY